jgi:uncharacterized protein DUF11
MRSTAVRAVCVLVAAACVFAFGVTPANAVTGQNDAPVLDATRSPALTAESQGAGVPLGAVGSPISNLVDYTTTPGGLDNVSDVDVTEGDPVYSLGAAIIGTDSTNGVWYFSSDGGASWSSVGSVSGSSALLLFGGNARLYFQPTSGFSGTIPAAVTFRAYDDSDGGTNGSRVAVTTTGGTSAFSVATDTASLTISSTSASLAVTDVGSPSPAPVFSQLTYTISVTDSGADATGVQLGDDWARSLRFRSLSTTQGTCAVKTKLRHVACNLGTVGGGTTATVMVVFATTRVGSVANTATATATNVTPDGNDTATSNVSVVR